MANLSHDVFSTVVFFLLYSSLPLVCSCKPGNPSLSCFFPKLHPVGEFLAPVNNGLFPLRVFLVSRDQPFLPQFGKYPNQLLQSIFPPGNASNNNPWKAAFLYPQVFPTPLTLF